jgi:nicotinate phosphoribosyltransferase
MYERCPLAQPEVERKLTEGIDFYKLTMGQIALERFSGTEVTFTFKNRDPHHPISEFVTVKALKERLDQIRSNGFSPEEIAYLASIKASDGSGRFDPEYLDYLANIKLPEVSIRYNDAGDLDISTSGNWAATSLWETVVMSECNEIYYDQLASVENIDKRALLVEGDRRLSAKIELLKERPDIKIADFGTRRRFSAGWQEYVIGRLASEIPNNFIGTSNPWFAYKYGVKPIGSYAHEMDMTYAALADAEGRNPLDGHDELMDDWFNRYGEDLSIALTDTFTSDFFFSDFPKEQAKLWRGLRHDSGDPFEFGNKAIEFYEQLGIDPKEKTIVFSDGLDIETIVKLADYFDGKINVLFGWGTTLMNDLGLRANNIVMKVTNVNGIETVKLSDDEGKHTGSAEKIGRYILAKDRELARV